LLVSLFLLTIISLPPGPMFFSELYGFGAMINMARESHHLLAMIGAILLLLILLSVIFYRFVAIYQSMRYEGEAIEKKVYMSEVIALMLFGAALIVLMLPASITFLRSIV
jgi:hydrogenase-4 component F